MKKIIATIVILTLILGVFTACKSEQPEEETNQDTQEMHYEFEFSDVYGDIHKLSDYQGKPVYLEVWGSWCGVCMSALPDIDKLAGEAEDFAVLSVVLPNEFGEKNKEDFIAWFNDLEYENLTVLLDEEGQLLDDFNISAFPTQVFFDANGNYAGGRLGGMSAETIIQEMQKISNQE